jgi:hypothetical protein
MAYGQLKLTHQNAIVCEEDGQLVVGTQHKATSNNVPVPIPFRSIGPIWFFELVTSAGKKAVVAFFRHGIRVWSPTNPGILWIWNEGIR